LTVFSSRSKLKWNARCRGVGWQIDRRKSKELSMDMDDLQVAILIETLKELVGSVNEQRQVLVNIRAELDRIANEIENVTEGRSRLHISTE
jgi:hypothetical protein